MSRIFTNWKIQNATLFGHHTIVNGHSLATSPLFTDDWLIELIEAVPEDAYHVSTLDPHCHDPRSRRDGTIAGLSGRDVLDAVRAGTIWLSLQDAGETNSAYADLLADIYDEMHERVPGLSTQNQKMSLLISSPNAQVPFHCDVPGQTLWQVRGEKRVYVYPNTPPFLPQAALETAILGDAREIALDYEPWFDDYAQMIDLKPGHMAHWPLHCPHRIVNGDSLNVSFTTEHWTATGRNAHAVNYANGILRKGLTSRFGRRFDIKELSQDTRGLSKWGKIGVAAVARFAGPQKRGDTPFNIDFQVDPTSPHGVRDIEAYDLRK